MTGTVTTIGAWFVLSVGLAFVAYTIGVLVGGGGGRGEENAMLGQLVIGFFLIIAVLELGWVL